jgi:hypothetical protein
LYGIEEGLCFDVVFLDLAKAFDKVPHRRLIEKVGRHGIEGKLKRLIGNWLSNRRQRVCIQGEMSGWIEVLSGVPQGSVLGPLLFLIYINDLDNGITSHVLKFADDTKIFGKVMEDMDRDRVQSDLDILVQWMERWQMEFNVGKCKVMHVGRNNKRYTYNIGGCLLKEVESEKDLGIIVAADMKSSEQCTQAYNKASRILGMIKRTIKNKEERTMVCLYKTLVRPHLEYCVSAWSPHYKKDKELLEKVQHRFTRMIENTTGVPYEERLRRLNLWTLEERRNRGDLIEVYKMFKNYASGAEVMFELDKNEKGTRGHSKKLVKERCVTDLRKYFFSNRVIKRWNMLDQQTVDAPSINAFKGRLDKYRRTRMGFFTD